MSKYKLSKLILFSSAFLLTLPSQAKRVPAVNEELVDFLPAGFYRKLSGDNIKCPPGHFMWVQNNQMLTIGSGQPVIFHTFNNTENRTISQNPNCSANTKTQVDDTSQGKVLSRTVTQLVKNDCANAVNTSEQKLVVSKIKGKTVVDLTIQVKRISPEKKTEQPVYCKYETGPS